MRPLHVACLCQSEAVVELLIKRGADVNAKDEDNETPLHGAARSEGSLAISEQLLAAGTDLEAIGWNDETSLHLACRYNPDVAKLLISKGANVNATSRFNGTALYYLSKGSGSEEVAKLLLAAGVEIEATDGRQTTPLHFASTYNPGLAKLLISKGADVNATDMYLQTPLHFTNSVDVAKLLLEAGADIKVVDGRLRTPLHTVESVEVVEFLLDGGVDIEARDDFGNTPLHEQHPAVAKLLIERGANVHALNEKRQTTLMRACSHDFTELVDILIERGVNINSVDKNGKTAINSAMLRDGAILERLVAAGADVNAGKPNPLFEAIHQGSLREIEVLIQAGADVTVREEIDDRTPLHQCTKGRSFDGHTIASLLIAAGADPMAKDKNGDTPLHLVSERGGPCVTAMQAVLLKAGANPFYHNKRGETPTRIMVERGELNGFYLRDIVLPAHWGGSRGRFYSGDSSLDTFYWKDHDVLRPIILRHDAEPIRLMYFDDERHWNELWKPMHLEQLKRRTWTTDDVWRSEYRHLMPVVRMEASLQLAVLQGCIDQDGIPNGDKACACMVKWCYIKAFRTLLVN
eukprot:TRINITY_DN12421_c1_g5_i4.p1 TRINITY_DN12421_c1_g5~~TRINITY_DN12421_c1_g5_i4.p1  ORF type:complete len:577 (+),score=87.60 TRINITY_DN12421_c1_g5_i4:441-2171(+)